ncbi:putative phage abortive infection protein [Seleniivibrio sp.]|uniref:putative phage abortive infection protein n=1 Tax=Seleniivibrio sp. TaxID=2898801 RepID=UPI0025D02E8F|nr:putative phage abortive infection protein [Seleniivibrio sp.]MCD8552920.1 putative phage abortive infection protein [Seleniivibrio sp.]
MLDLYNDILNNIVIDKDATSEDQKKEKFHGREAINYSMKNVIERIYINSKDRYFLDVVNDKPWLPRSSSGKVTVSDKIQAVIPKYLKDNNDQFGHYFRHIFQTIKFADENMIEKELIDNNAKYGKKKNTSAYKYVKILRAQLSNTELALLFYTSLTSEGKNFIDLGYFQDYETL